MPDSFVPGSGGNNAGYAVVYPDDDLQRMQIANNMHQANLAQQQRLEQQRKEEAAHRYALNKYYGNQFDFSKFDTGTDLNKSINDLLIQGKKQFTDVLNQPGASDEDIDRAADEALIPAMKLYQIGTAIKRNIDGTVSGYDKKDGIDTGSLAKQAYIQALYKPDPKTGKLVLKNTDELNQIDPEHNYAADIVNNTPQLVSKGNVDLEGGFKSMIPQTVKNSGEYYDGKGVKHKGSWEAQIYQGAQDVVRDAKGVSKVVTVNDPLPVTDAQGNPVIDPKTGKQAVINQVPDVVLQHFQQTPGQKAALDVATIKYLQSHPATAGENAIPGTPGFEIAKKAMLYDMVDQFGAKRINEAKGVQAPGFVIKNMLGIPQGGSAKSGADTEAPPTVDLYSPILKLASEKGRDNPDNPKTYVQMNMLNSTAQKIILDIARNSVGGGTISSKYDKYGVEGKDIGVRDIYLKKNKADGQIYIRSAGDDKVIAPLDPNSLNVPANIEAFKLAGNKSKAKAAKNINISTGNSAGATYNLGGKTITEEQLKKGAAKYNMTLDQYKKSIGL